MRKSLRSLSLVIAFGLLAIFLPLLHGSGTQVAAAGDFTVENGVLVKYNGAGGEVVVPSTVSAIGREAFDGCVSLTKVVIPSTVRSIDYAAFRGCTGLTDVVIPNSVNNLGYGSFYNCTNLESIILSENLESIPYMSFQNTALTEVDIPSGVVRLEKQCFWGISSLRYVNIPKTVTTIETNAFYGCNSITDFFYEGTAEEWNSVVSKTGFNVSGATMHYSSSLYDFDIVDNVVMGYKGTGGSVIIPRGVTAIDAYVFRGRTDITSITIPDSVRTIGAEAFSYCASLTSLSFPEGLTSIGDSAFLYCKGVTTLSLPSSLCRIGSFAFSHCTSLTTVTVPQGVTAVGDSAFFGCSGLVSVSLPASVTSIGQRALGRCQNLKGWTLNTANASFVIENDVLYNSAKTRLIRCLPTKAGFFSIPDSVTSIDEDAFSCCAKLTGLWIPSGITTLPYDVFYNCTALKTMSIPKSVTEFGFLSFCYTEIADIYYEGTEPEWNRIIKERKQEDSDEIDSCFLNDSAVIHYSSYNTNPDFEIIDGALIKYKGSDTTVSVPLSVSRIKDDAFKDTGVQVIYLPYSLVSVEDGAFSDCPTLTAIYVDSLNRSFASRDGVLYNKDFTILVRYPAARAGENYTLPSTVTELADDSFYQNKNLKSVDLPDALRKIGYYAFFKAEKLRRLVIPTNVTQIGYYAFAEDNLEIVVIIAKSPTVDRAAFHNVTFGKIHYYYSYSDWNSSDWPAAFSGGMLGAYMCYNFRTPKVTTPPQSQIVTRGDEMTISVEAVGSELTYQWFYKKKGGDWYVWKGRTHASETVTPNDSWDGIQLYCMITDSAECALISDTATVTLKDPVFAILSQTESDCHLLKGEEICLYVEATGLDLSYQWYYKKTGQSGWVKWNGRTHASETVTPNDTWDGIQLYCKLTDTKGKSINSEVITIHLTEPLRIIEQPKSQTVTKGDSLTVSVRVNREDAAYQWYYKKKNQQEWSLWKGRTHASETVTPNDTWDGIQLYCEVSVSNDNGEEFVVSEPATVTLTAAAGPVITTQPKSQTIHLGDSLTLFLKATGNGLKYQWYFRKAGQNDFSKWNGRTHASETVTPNATWNGIQLYCVVTDSAGKSVNSDTVTITVKTGPVITTQPKSQTVSLGASLTLSLKATGDGLTYQWYFKKTGQSSFRAWNGRTHATETVTPNATWNGIQLYCIVTDSAGKSVNSDTVTITVKTGPVITVQPKSQTVTLGQSVTVSLTATGNGLTYQWYYKKVGQNVFSKWNDHTSTSETCTPNATWNGIQLYCIVTDSAGNSVTSDTITVTVR